MPHKTIEVNMFTATDDGYFLKDVDDDDVLWKLVVPEGREYILEMLVRSIKCLNMPLKYEGREDDTLTYRHATGDSFEPTLDFVKVVIGSPA